MASTYSYLITADGSFDRAAIMRDAAKMAKSQAAGPLLPGFRRQTYRQALSACLKLSWSCAKAARADFALPAAEQARRDERASALFGAAMIDHTPTYTRVRDAIEARF